MRLSMLDLFSGLGGFSYALHSLCKTVAYCECDKYAIACLTGAIHQGLIDAAPIFTDVRTLDPTIIPGRLDVITAGFPCTDLSEHRVEVRISGPEIPARVAHLPCAGYEA